MGDRQDVAQGYRAKAVAQAAAWLPLAVLGGLLVAAATLSAQAWAQSQPVVDTSYRLGTGDRIEIRVFGEPDLSIETRIGDDGIIVYPFLGELNLSGMTVRELESRIVNGLRPDYLVNPTVTVSLVEYRNFFIYGAVRSPGGFPFQPGLSVRQAVAVAGGFTERASRNRIVVVRDGDASGNEQSISLDQTVQPGDTITVRESFF
ncbi:MAG: polysaccharide export protein [Gammaproteobacteria bacterium]|nr:polysaccharide export protein [Gammaproteobacteria bacterium]